MKATATARATAVLFGDGHAQRAVADMVVDLGLTPCSLSDATSLDERAEVALCVIDLQTATDALRTIRLVRAAHPAAVIIGVADPERPGAGADAIRAGAFDVLQPPVTRRDLEALVANATEQQTPAPKRARTSPPCEYGLVGASPAMREVIALVARTASVRTHLLVTGERGTGRELIARAIHDLGPSRQSAFVALDCAGLSPDELELDLFGNVNRRAANASERRSLERIERHCRLVDATGGTLFLEQLAEMPARVQSRLVRVLRDREVFAGHDRQALAVDVRVIASVDASFEAAVEDGRVRRDLFDRLASIRIEVPPLRQRREDIPLLAAHFLKDSCRRRQLPLKTLTRPALTLLAALPWRGNGPEIRTLVDRLVLMVPGGLIRLEDVLAHTQLDAGISPTGCDATLRQARARFERDYIAAVLQHHHGRIAEAARVLGIQRTNLYRKMRRLNVLRGKSARRGA